MAAIREIMVWGRFLQLPVKNGAPMRRVRFLLDGQLVHSFEIEWAEETPDFYVYADISTYRQKQLTIEANDLPPEALRSVVQSGAMRPAPDLYQEKLRPQFHFSACRGWNNDPNGLMYYAGEYHLFWQHNPFGVKWGNMHWGHAIGPDLVHWQELGDALQPDALGTCYSGSGVVDWYNSAGLQTGDEKVMVCIYTSAGGTSPESQGQPFTQSLAYSNDRGRAWKKYAGNPVLGHIAGRNRDPKVIWHGRTSRWIMALYLEGNHYALFSSPNLKEWTLLCDFDLPGAAECPDFFPLAVDGNPANNRWLFWAANGAYLLGQFDGKVFAPDGPPLRYGWTDRTSYAAQTWSDIPPSDGRRIQIAWLRVNLPGMPFNQCMTFPCELTLRTTPEGIRLFSWPVREIEKLVNRSTTWEPAMLEPGERPLDVGGELWDIEAVFEPGDAAAFGFNICGVPVTYDVAQGHLSCEGYAAPLQPVQNEIALRILADRASLEVFGNEGQVMLPIPALLGEREKSLSLFSQGGRARLKRLEVRELHSIWNG